MPATVAVNAVIAGSLLMFGGAYTWAALALISVAAFVALVIRPTIVARDGLGRLDLALLATIAVVALQLVPLPAGLLGVVSPGAQAYAAAVSLAPASSASVSIAPGATGYSLALIVAAALMYWTCRHVFARGGARRFVRGVAWTGFAAALVAIVQRATSPYAIYWKWQPEFVNAQPFGPFVNRNFFATWMVMAAPLCVGYLLARVAARPGGSSIDWFNRLARAIDTRGLWLAAAVCVMAVSIVLSGSRSGIVGLASAAAAFWLVAQRRLNRRTRTWLAGLGLLVILALTAWANLDAVANRVSETLEGTDRASRWTIWAETVPALRDYWLTGSGAGTYETAMRLYQRTQRSAVYYNQAHNQYLQVATEGGLVMVLMVAWTLAAGIGTARQWLLIERSSRYWLRAGAVASLAGIAVQSVWDTGLRMPANAFLFAAVAALATYQRSEDVAP